MHDMIIFKIKPAKTTLVDYQTLKNIFMKIITVILFINLRLKSSQNMSFGTKIHFPKKFK